MRKCEITLGYSRDLNEFVCGMVKICFILYEYIFQIYFYLRSEIYQLY